MNGFEIAVLIIVILLLGAFVAWKVVSYVRKKQGKPTKGGGCGCGCAGCAASGSCSIAAALNGKKDGKDDVMPEIAVQSTVTCSFDDIIESMNSKK